MGDELLNFMSIKIKNIATLLFTVVSLAGSKKQVPRYEFKFINKERRSAKVRQPVEANKQVVKNKTLFK